jgi:Bacterial archaeo-eukaryotic release factor family 3
MNSLLQDERELIEASNYMPAVSIIMPFQPVFSSRAELEYRLVQVIREVQKELLKNYIREKASPVLDKLRRIIRDLDYNTNKKSVAIFASPLLEKVFYLDLPMAERIVIDDSFEIRDLLYSRKQNLHYLLFILSAEKAKLYLGDISGFTRIESGIAESVDAYLNDLPEKVGNFSDPKKRKEIMLDKFLRHMDESLVIILKSHSLPVFILAPKRVAGHFGQITQHEETIVKYIHGNFIDSTDKEINTAIQPYLADWLKTRQSELLDRLNAAADEKKLSFGIRDVWSAASKKDGRLLVVEKGFVFPARQGSRSDLIYQGNSHVDKAFYIKDVVDEVMEKVVQNGGDIEFVDNGALKDYHHIALVRYY